MFTLVLCLSSPHTHTHARARAQVLVTPVGRLKVCGLGVSEALAGEVVPSGAEELLQLQRDDVVVSCAGGCLWGEGWCLGGVWRGGVRGGTAAP